MSDQGVVFRTDIQNAQLAIPPINIFFDAFRFAKVSTVAFNMSVRVCQSTNVQDCVFVVSK